VIFEIQRQSVAPAALVSEIVMRSDPHRFGVDDCDVGLVLDDDIETGLAISASGSEMLAN